MAAPRPGPSASKRAPSPEPGQEPDEIIGDFRRGKEIGKGSFANVYLAQHRKKKSYAAVKVVQMSKLSQRLKANLESEIALLKNMKHPHIVALFTTIERPLFFYLVMEYCPLSDLSQFLKKRHSLSNYPETQEIFRRYPNPQYGGFNEVLSRHFIKQIASALQYLRAGNLIHRDIKPQNLLLNPAPSFMAKQRPEDVPLAASEHSLATPVGVQSLPMLKVADFGFARHLPSTSMAETLCGSPLYMAPEILRYEKYDARADLWSAGGVLYEMVVGKPPFRAQNHVELLRKIERANDVITFDNKNMTISRPMKDLIRRLLTKSPLERISYEDFFAHPLITGDIPGLVEDDKQYAEPKPPAEVSEISRRIATQATDPPIERRKSSDTTTKPRTTPLETPARASKKASDQDMKQPPEDARRRPSGSGATQAEPTGVPMQRRTSQREQPKQRRPSIVAHQTAPARENLVGAAPSQPPAARMERRPSRTSPLTGPPMVREPSSVEPAKSRPDRNSREIRERTAQDVAFEKEYVMIEKRAVEINAFADELDANRGSPSNNNPGAMVRRATTQGQPVPVAGVQPSSPSRALTAATRQPHQRAGSFERRYAPSPQSATNMLTKALNAANVRLFGALGTSPPFGKGASPPPGYGAYPIYPAPQNALLLGDGGEGKAPMDEDSKLVRIMEEAAHRSDVIFGFAEVKYRQLLPATPSTADALGIQQIGAAEGPLTGSGEEDKDMTTVAIVGVAEEALVLYVKTLAILAKTIDLAGHWWEKQGRTDAAVSDATTPRTSTSPPADVGKRMNGVVQWARNRFNECLEKSEVVGRRLQAAQKQLPEDHPGHPENQASNSKGPGGTITASAEQIHITSGVTAEKLMFERAVEMSRAAAVNELVGEAMADCELSYVTAVLLLEAVLESDDEPLMRKPSAKKDKAGDEIVNGMETEDRQTVIKSETTQYQPSARVSILLTWSVLQSSTERAPASVPSARKSTPRPRRNTSSRRRSPPPAAAIAAGTRLPSPR